jgi:hypothetical protein
MLHKRTGDEQRVQPIWWRLITTSVVFLLVYMRWVKILVPDYLEVGGRAGSTEEINQAGAQPATRIRQMARQ